MESFQEQHKQQQVIYKNGGFVYESTPDTPQPGPGQVLIEVNYSTINPYDRLIFGKNQEEGFIMGSDGCGYVIQVGEGVDSDKYLNKLVSFNKGGWSRYAVKDTNNLILYDNKDFDARNAANAYINPLTACAMLDFAKTHKATGVVILAASSQLAKQLIKLCQKEGIETVNIVRKDEQVHELKTSLSAKYVFNQEKENFIQDLQQVMDEVKPTVLFECLGGDLPGKVFATMPANSWMVVYGSLTKTNPSFDSYDFRWKNKNITSLILHRWLTSLTPEQQQEWFKYVADDLQYKNGDIFGSKIIKEVKLEDWFESMNESEKFASEGKYIIKCKRE